MNLCLLRSKRVWIAVAIAALDQAAFAQSPSNVVAGALVSGAVSVSGDQHRIVGRFGACGLFLEGERSRIYPEIGGVLAGAATVEIAIDPRPTPGLPIAFSAQRGSFATIDGALLEVSYRSTGDAVFTSAALPESNEPGKTHSGLLPATAATARGLDYFVTTEIGPFSLRFPPGAGPESPAHAEVRLDAFTNDALATAAGTYRMLGVALHLDDPTRPDRVLGDELGAQSVDRWRLLRWLPEDERYEEYSASMAVTAMDPGRAYWLISAENAALDLDGWSTLPQSGSVEISLLPGWNQIANPFAFPVDLEAITIAVGNEELSFSEAVDRSLIEAAPLHRYTGSGYTSSSRSLAPWDGYFVANLDVEERTIRWRIPARAAVAGLEGATIASRDVAGAAVQPETLASGWLLRLEAQLEDGSRAAVETGVLEAATQGFDRADALAPPASPAGGIGFHVRGQGLSNGRLALSRDLRPASSSAQERWELVLSATSPQACRVVPDLQGAMPPGATFRLVDLELGQEYDLLGSGPREIGFMVGAAPRSYELRFDANGSNPSGGIHRPLGPIRPNPVRDSATVAFAMASAGRTEIAVFDAGGRRVRLLLARHLASGSHSLVWDGRDDRGERVAAGVYFVELGSGDARHSERVAVIR